MSTARPSTSGRVVSASAPRPSPKTALVTAAPATPKPIGDGAVKQGQLLCLNKEQNEYVRCYCVLTSNTLSFLIHGGKQSRHLRPRVYLAAIRGLYAEIDDAPKKGVTPSPDDLPDLHYHVILVELATDIVVLRTVERESLKGWIESLSEVLPEIPLRHVAAVDGPQRGHFPPQFDALLFPRNHPGALKYSPVRRTQSRQTTAMEVAPRPVLSMAAPTQRTRMASLSAAAPNRGPVIRKLPAAHVDPVSRVSDEQQYSNRDKSASPHKADIVPLAAADEPVAKTRKRVVVVSDENDRDHASEQVATLAAANAALADENQRLKEELSKAKGMCCELELDATNASVRVLELESDVRMLKDGAAEWRRRYTSLEQQLQVQDEGFAERIRREKEEQLEFLREEINTQWSAMKRQWSERESALTDEIAALRSELEAVPRTNT